MATTREEQLKQQQMMQEQAAQQRAAAAAQPNTAAASQQAAAAQPVQQQATYTPGADVLEAQQQMKNAQASKPGEYQQSDAVTQAYQALQANQAAKPQSYTSKIGAQLDNILNQITNPQDFKYSFNGDELFKYYADLYTQKGKQAANDVMGQAAALTGGYGNSYGQQVANQTYDQYLLNLYDKGMDLRDRAYQQYQDKLANQYNQYNTLANADQIDYGRYRDTVGDWENERDYLTNRYDTERNYDYNQHRDTVSDWQADRDYYTNLYQNTSNTDYSRYADQRDYDENVRQFNESLDWDKMSAQQKYAAEYAMNILANGQMPSAELLQAAGLSAEDAAKMMAQLEAAGGSGGNGGGGGKYYVDMLGNYYELNSAGKYVKVDPNKVNRSYQVDTSKMDAILGQDIMNAWSNASKQQAAAANNANNTGAAVTPTASELGTNYKKDKAANTLLSAVSNLNVGNMWGSASGAAASQKRNDQISNVKTNNAAEEAERKKYQQYYSGK